MKFNKIFEKYMNEKKSMEGYNFYNKDLSEIPEEVRGKDVKGNLDLGKNNIKSLKGGPITVSGHFSVNNNDLTSLEGAPKSADRFSVDRNDLGKLTGISDNTYGSFSCSNCNLSNLKGLPNIKRVLDVSNNPLKSLEGLEKNKKYHTIKVTGTGIKRDQVEEYTEKHGIKYKSIQD